MWAFIRSPTRSFSPHVGLVCGRLAIRPHTSFTHAEGAGVWAFITSPTRPSPSPHPKLAVDMCFCRVHGNCPSFACKQMATLFYPNCHVFLHGTWQLPSVHVSRWQLFLLHGNCPSVLVRTWQLSLLPEHVFLPCLFCSATWQLPSVSGWQLLKF